MAKKKSRSRANSNGRPTYQPMPDLSSDEFEVLKADIAENGLQYPVIQDELDVETECVEIGTTRLEKGMGAKKRKRKKRSR